MLPIGAVSGTIEKGGQEHGICVYGICCDTDCASGCRPCAGGGLNKRGGKAMPILFAALGTPLASFMEGCVLGASIYLVAKGAKNPLKHKK